MLFGVLILWYRFRQMHGGSLGRGPILLLVQSADELGFFWDSDQVGWIRPGFPPLRVMIGPIQHFRCAIWQAWPAQSCH